MLYVILALGVLLVGAALYLAIETAPAYKEFRLHYRGGYNAFWAARIKARASFCICRAQIKSLYFWYPCKEKEEKEKAFKNKGGDSAFRHCS